MSKAFSLKEIEKLLKVCKTRGVSYFEYGDLKISMEVPHQSSMTPAPSPRGSAKKAKQITDKSELQNQYDVAQEALETLHVEDPSAYEALLMQGELGEEKNH